MEGLLIFALIFGVPMLVSWLVDTIREANAKEKAQQREKAAIELIPPESHLANSILGTKERISLLKKRIYPIQHNLSDNTQSNQFSEKNPRNAAASGGAKNSRYVELLGRCPECSNGHLKVRSGQYGKFIACSAYPNCKYTKNFEVARQEYSHKTQEEIKLLIKKAYQSI